VRYLVFVGVWEGWLGRWDALVGAADKLVHPPLCHQPDQPPRTNSRRRPQTHPPHQTRAYGQDVTFVANDWHAALLPVLLKQRFQPGGVYPNAACLLAIHNMAHQVGLVCIGCGVVFTCGCASGLGFFWQSSSILAVLADDNKSTNLLQPPTPLNHHSQGVFPANSFNGLSLPGGCYSLLEWKVPQEKGVRSSQHRDTTINVLKVRA